MKLRQLKKSEVKAGMRVLMRVDFNVPLSRGRVGRGADFRIRAALPAIEAMAAKGAKVVLMSHLGDPAGKRDAKLSLRPVANYLRRHMAAPVRFCEASVGRTAQKAVREMRDGDILLLENLRFHAGEEKNDPKFARALAELGDVYVNDAFGVCHRKHASVHAITKYLPSYAGDLITTEVRQLSRRWARPMVLILGGIKLTTKMPLLKYFGSRVDKILIGSGLANVLLRAKYGDVWQPRDYMITDAELRSARQLLKTFGDKLVLPVDGVSQRSGMRRILVRTDRAQRGEGLIDVGNKTTRAFIDECRAAKTILWNGPLGIAERRIGRVSSQRLAKFLMQSDAITIVGGGDTIEFLERYADLSQFSVVSTGGGAMLAFMSGEKMPGLDVLRASK